MISRKKSIILRRRPGRAFTSVGDGRWNDPSTWSKLNNGEYPQYPSDTVTIAAGHEVTIPVGLSVNPGAVLLSAGNNTSTDRTKLIINGALKLGGNLSLVTITSIEMGAGAIFDLAGFTVTPSGGDVKYVWTGTSGNRAQVISTGARGSFASPGASTLICTIDFVSFSGLATSTFGRSHTSALTQHIEDSTFNDMADFSLDETSTNVNAGFSFQRNDIRNPHSGSAKQPNIAYSSQALGTSPRNIKNNTWSGGAALGKITISAMPQLTALSGNVVDRFYLDNPNAGFGEPTLSGNFWSNTAGDDQAFLFSGGSPPIFDGEYLYYEGGFHVFGNGQGSNQTVRNSVHECPTSVGANWYLWNNAFTFALTYQNNIFLGTGTPLSLTGASSPAIDFSNNTMYMSEGQTSFPGAADFGAFETEQTGNLTGTVNYYNNLFADQNTNPGGTTDFECHITLRNAVGTQITLADFNGHAGYNNAGTYGATTIGYYQSRSNTTFTAGTNDVHADPLFVDKTRALATWDASLGGPGTAAHAIAEMLKANGYNGATFNAGYTPAALLTYVKAGFQPSGAGATAYNGTGQGGANIGFR